MSYKIDTIPQFEKQSKRLAKKYPSFKKELSDLIIKLEKDPQQGNALGNNFFKIRLSIASKGKGKSGGARVITFVKVIKSVVYLTSVYDKGEKDTLSKQELEKIFEQIP